MTTVERLYDKHGFAFLKHADRQYSLSFCMENKCIDLAKIVDFPLVKLIYELNADIYDKVRLDIHSEREATLNLLMKPLFEDLGMPQRFSYVNLVKTVGENNIIFVAETIKHERPPDMPAEAELMPMDQMMCICDIVSPHAIRFTFHIRFAPTMIIPPMVEKMVGLILYKIFNKVKQFIENVAM